MAAQVVVAHDVGEQLALLEDLDAGVAQDAGEGVVLALGGRQVGGVLEELLGEHGGVDELELVARTVDQDGVQLANLGVHVDHVSLDSAPVRPNRGRRLVVVLPTH